MLSQQIYTSKTTSHLPINTRTCNVRLTTNAANADTIALSKEQQQCPRNHRNENTTNHTNIFSAPIPITASKYDVHLSTECFDPTIQNTPPNEFILNLQERLHSYFNG
jgi:hypothetical protein